MPTDPIEDAIREVQQMRLRMAEIEAAARSMAGPEPPVYYVDQLEDRAFYLEHRGELGQLIREGRIRERPAPEPSAPATPPAPAAPTGTADGGARGTAPTVELTSANLNDREFYTKNRTEIMRAVREGRIREG